MLKELIKVERGFQTSANIAYDLFSDDKIESFIPTMSALGIIEDVLLSTVDSSSQRARLLVGAYGRGKSHIILVLMSLLFKKNIQLFDRLLSKMKEVNLDLYNFADEYIHSNKKLLPIIINGSSTSLTQSFLFSIQQSLTNFGMEKLMPDTHFNAALKTILDWKANYPKTYEALIEVIDRPIDSFLLALQEYEVEAYEVFEKLYPKLTSGGVFNPFFSADVIELYESVVSRISDYGYSGVYIVYDEFSKYLESSIAKASINDVKLLQDFAEKCVRSGPKQMHLMLISHKDISNYIDDKLPKEKVDGWRGISGRFEHINLQDNFSQIYEIISSVLTKDAEAWDNYIQKHQHLFSDIETRFLNMGLVHPDDIDTVSKGCFPLHPVTTFFLPRLSERVAQNERTLFTFLSSDQKNTLPVFLEKSKLEFDLLTPDYIYDYFETSLRQEAWTTDIYKLYLTSKNILRQLPVNSLCSKIIKTISLIYFVEQYEIISPTADAIIDVFRYSVPEYQEITDAINDLIKQGFIYNKLSNNFLQLKDNSTKNIDINAEIQKYVEAKRGSICITEVLNRNSFDKFLYPTAYNDDHDVIRYFKVVFFHSTSLLESGVSHDKIEAADGVIYAVIPDSEIDISRVKKAIAQMTINDRQNIYVVPNFYIDIEPIVLEYYAALQLRELAANDEFLKDEYSIRIDDLEDVISKFVTAYLHPERNKVDYYHLGEKKNIYRKAHLSSLLSQICKNAYPKYPIINNETINKNMLPSTAINSRTKLVGGLLDDHLKPNLGLTGTGQDVSFMRSTLIKPGILCEADINPVINLEPADSNIANMLSIIFEFLTNASQEKNFKQLYDTLTLPEHGIGLKLGLIPVYIAAVLHICKKNVIIKHSGDETRITSDLLNKINESPEQFTVLCEEWTPEKRAYITNLEEIFKDHINPYEKSFNSFTYIVLAMNRWFINQPKYVKEMEYIYMGCTANSELLPIPVKVKRFINSIKIAPNNAYEYLFSVLPSIFDSQLVNQTLIEQIKKAVDIYDSALNNLIATLSEDIKLIFNGSSSSSLYSAVIEWYSVLNPETLNYLFTGNESRILEIMRNITYDEGAFVRSLCRVVSSLHVNDWQMDTIETFLDDIKVFKSKVEEYDQRLHTRETSVTNNYRLIVIDQDGRETIKVFPKTDVSPKAQMLLNEMSSNIEEYGEALTGQEKRQVLLVLLERLC